MSERQQSLIDSINESIRREIEETWESGRPITVEKDGKIVHVYPDGHTEEAKQ